MPAAACRLRAAWLVVFVGGLVAVPACKKSRPTAATDSPTPSPDATSKFGPPGGLLPSLPGSQPTVPAPGTPPSAPLDPTLPTPPITPLVRIVDPLTRVSSQNNLREIATGLLNFHAAYGRFPVGLADSTGRPGLSWRVAILPFIDQEPLYKQFKLDEPWNSEHNKKLIGQMPKLYGVGNRPTNGYTFYRSFAGPGAFLPPPTQPARPGQPILGLQIEAIADGPANTLMVAEAAEPVIWTKPDDLPFAPGKPPRLGDGVFAGGFHALFCDGNIRYLPTTLDATTLGHLIQVDDGQIVNLP